jgi:hypothetical protein
VAPNITVLPTMVLAVDTPRYAGPLMKANRKVIVEGWP